MKTKHFQNIHLQISIDNQCKSHKTFNRQNHNFTQFKSVISMQNYDEYVILLHIHVYLICIKLKFTEKYMHLTNDYLHIICIFRAYRNHGNSIKVQLHATNENSHTHKHASRTASASVLASVICFRSSFTRLYVVARGYVRCMKLTIISQTLVPMLK